jgi:integrase
MRGIIHKDLSHELPKIRVPTDARIPSVWDQELIDKLLGAVDRSSVRGKRDYAILLLASRLGLRVGDIRALRLDDIKWADSRIEILQSKQKTPLSLPLTEEVGQALIDYLKSGPTPPIRDIERSSSNCIVPMTLSPGTTYTILSHIGVVLLVSRFAANNGEGYILYATVWLLDSFRRVRHFILFLRS